MVKTKNNKKKRAIICRANLPVVLFCALILACQITQSFGDDNQKSSLPTNQEYSFDVISSGASLEDIKATDGGDYFILTPGGDKLNPSRECRLNECALGPWAFTQDEGKPKLPVIYERVALPYDSENIAIEIISAESKEEKISKHIYPSPKKVLRKDENGLAFVADEFYRDDEFYKNYQGFYPKTAQIEAVEEIRGLKYAVIAVSPYQYNPSTKTLRTNEKITLRVSWQSDEPALDTEKIKKDNFLKSVIGKIHNLKQLAATLDSQEKQNDLLRLTDDLTSNSSDFGQVTRPTDLLIPVHTDYLIITADDFYNSSALNNLANFRASRLGGRYDVTIVKVEGIYNTNFPDKVGTETNEQLIKMFIKYAYDNWNGNDVPLKYVVIVGDAITDDNDHQIDAPNLVPTHISSFFAFGAHVATDYWYSCLDGSYPFYLNDTFDTAADIAIGRFAVRAEQELNRVVNKTINYETTFLDWPGEWRSKDALISGFAIDEISFVVDTRNAYTALRNNYFLPNYQETPVENRDDESLYSDDGAGSLLFREKIKTYFNQGSLMLIAAAHGNLYQWHDGSNGFIFEASDINLLNNKGKLPIVVNMACQTGMFDSGVRDSLGEAFLKNSEAGAIAFVGSSRNEDTLAYQMILGLTRELMDNNLTLGQALSVGKLDAQFVYRLLNNLLGDPALNVAKVKQESSKPNLSGSLRFFETSEDKVTFFTKIKNSGLGEARNVTIDLYEGYPESGGVRIPFDVVPVPLVSGNSEVLYEIEMPLWNPQYTGNIYMVIDEDNLISELNEDDNKTTGLFYFWTPPFKTSYIASESFNPANWANKIVWTDSDASVNSFYLYDLGPDGLPRTDDDSGVVSFTTTDSLKADAKISQNKIVWTDNRSGNADIYFYDLGEDGLLNTSDDSGEVALTQAVEEQSHASIAGNKIVWLDNRDGNYEVYFYDLGEDGLINTGDDSGEVRLTTYSSNKGSPIVSGNRIVWADNRHGPSEIYLYDLGYDGVYGTDDDSGEIRVTTDLTSKYSISFSGNKIIWSAYAGMYQATVYMYDLGADGIFGTDDDSGKVRVNPNTSFYPYETAIFGNKIVWKHFSKELYLYDIGPDGLFGTGDDVAEKRIAVDSKSFRIHNSRVIVTDSDNDVFLIDVNSPPELNSIGNKIIRVGSQASFRITAIDQDGDNLTYSVSNLPRGAVFNSATQTFIWRPRAADVGIYYVTFMVTDSFGGFDSETIQITVKKKTIFYPDLRPSQLPIMEE